MYSDRWSPTLRQGDILGPVDVPLLGQGAEQKVVADLVDPIGRTASSPSSWLVPTDAKLLVVVSHDCEFNDGKRDRILLARIVRGYGANPRQIPPDEALASNDVAARVNARLPVHGVDTFVFEPLEGLFETHYSASFTTIAPYRVDFVERLHAAKRAELEHSQRLLLRRKVAAFFNRSPDDIPEDEKLPPDEVLARVGGGTA